MFLPLPPLPVPLLPVPLLPILPAPPPPPEYHGLDIEPELPPILPKHPCPDG